MSDRELSILFANTIEFIHQGKQLGLAEKVKKAIQLEWMNRLEAFQRGDYKADSPETGVLKTIGYKVGNDAKAMYFIRRAFGYMTQMSIMRKFF